MLCLYQGFVICCVYIKDLLYVVFISRTCYMLCLYQGFVICCVYIKYLSSKCSLLMETSQFIWFADGL